MGEERGKESGSKGRREKQGRLPSISFAGVADPQVQELAQAQVSPIGRVKLRGASANSDAAHESLLEMVRASPRSAEREAEEWKAKESSAFPYALLSL